jgi:hypothetical protein
LNWEAPPFTKLRRITPTSTKPRMDLTGMEPGAASSKLPGGWWSGRIRTGPLSSFFCASLSRTLPTVSSCSKQTIGCCTATHQGISNSTSLLHSFTRRKLNHTVFITVMLMTRQVTCNYGSPRFSAQLMLLLSLLLLLLLLCCCVV